MNTRIVVPVLRKRKAQPLLKPLARFGLTALVLLLALAVMANYCGTWPLHLAAAWTLVSSFSVFGFLVWSLEALGGEL